MFLTSNDRLESQIVAGDHLFLLYTERRSCIFLVMREFDKASSTFRLLSCGDALGFNILSKSTSLELLEPPNIALHPADLQSSLFHYLDSHSLKTYLSRDIQNFEIVFLWLEKHNSLNEEIGRVPDHERR